MILGGSLAALVVRNVSEHQMALDPQAILIEGTRYEVLSDSATVQSANKGGLGANKGPAKFVGGGALGGSVQPAARPSGHAP